METMFSWSFKPWKLKQYNHYPNLFLYTTTISGVTVIIVGRFQVLVRKVCYE